MKITLWPPLAENLLLFQPYMPGHAPGVPYLELDSQTHRRLVWTGTAALRESGTSFPSPMHHLEENGRGGRFKRHLFL